MGYESRIFIVDRYETTAANYTWVHADEIARFDLCKMGSFMVNGAMFRDIFKTEIDFDLYIGNERTKEDNYGEHCKYTDIETVLNWLYKFQEEENYRRVYPLVSCLEWLKKDKSSWGNIVIVHYGY